MSDLPDAEHVRVKGRNEHAMNINAFTMASADRQWFYKPGTSPPRAAGRISPLSPALVPGYSSEAAARSQRRARIRAYAQGKAGRELSDQEIMRVRIGRRDTEE